MLTEQQYWQAIRTKICAKCVDGDGNGGCLVPHNAECAMKTFFPQVLEVVGSTYSTSIMPYEEQLLSRICSACTNQSPTGMCVLRDDVDCALDRYFPLIVEVIEEAQLRDRLFQK
jgi:hypothetical protein